MRAVVILVQSIQKIHILLVNGKSKFLHWQRCAPDWLIWGLRKFLSEQPSEVLPEPVCAHTLFREHREHRDPDRLLLPEAHRPVPECRCPGSSRSVLSDNTMDDIQSDLQPVQCRIFFQLFQIVDVKVADANGTGAPGA